MLSSYLLGCSSPVIAQNLVVLCDSNNPPYSVGDEEGGLAKGGTAVQLVEEIFLSIDGVDVEVKSLPWARCLEEAKRGRIDGVLKLLRNPKRSEFLVFSEPIYQSVQRIFFLSEKFPDGISWSSLSDLAGIRFGIVRGGSYGEAIDDGLREGVLDSEEAGSDEQNYEKLIAGRIDAIVDNEIMAAGHLERLGASSKVRASEQISISRDVRIGISKKSDAVSLLPEINQALAALTEEGRAEKIIKGQD